MGSESNSGRVGGVVGGGRAGGQTIPATMKKVVQHLKEIVDCPEHEIYAILKECNMDPNHAVERLLSQDTFHEVKSKRERRKETKDSYDSRPRSYSTVFNHGGKAGSERNANQTGPTYVGYNELGKAVNKGDNASVCHFVPSSTACPLGENSSSQVPFDGGSFNTDDGRSSIGMNNSVCTSAQSSAGLQSVWSAQSRGHLSMADIVRMGKPQKGSQMLNGSSFASEDAATHHHTKTSLVSGPTQLQSVNNQELPCQNHAFQSVFNDEWPIMDQPRDDKTRNAYAFLDATMSSENFDLHGSESDMPAKCRSNVVQISEGDLSIEKNNMDNVDSNSFSTRHTIISDCERACNCSTAPQDLSSYDQEKCISDPQEGLRSRSKSKSSGPLLEDAILDVSLAAADFQFLSLGDDNLDVLPTNDDQAVVLPYHLQALAAQCTHLSFGTYNSGSNSVSSTQLASDLFGNKVDETDSAVDSSSAFLDSSNYHVDEQLQLTYDKLRETAGYGNHGSLASSQAKSTNPIASQEALEQENITQTVPASSFGRGFTHMLPFVKEELQSRDHHTFPIQMHADSDPIMGDLMVSKLKSTRDSDFRQSSGLISHTLPSGYSNSVTSINNTAISMPEALRSSTFSVSQMSSIRPQHQSVQSTPSMEQLANVLGYHSMPQKHASIVPLDLRQKYLDSIAYNQSLIDLKYGLSGNRSEISSSRLPLSARDASGYGNFGSTTYNTGNVLHNQSIAPVITTNGIDDILRSQYKGGNNINLQQNGSLSTWGSGPESRNLASVPGSAYYSFPGHNQNHVDYQLPPMHYGTPGYSDHPSQSGIIAKHVGRSDSQDLLSWQLQQSWHNGY